MRVGCHSAAISGNRSANERPGAGALTGARFLAGFCLSPSEAAARSSLVRRLRPFLPQLGQPGQRTRFPMTAGHSWPHPEHCHQAFSFLEKLTSDGVRSPFRVGCHSAASWGHRSASEFPALGTAFAVRAHSGHDVRRWVRPDTCLCHSWRQTRHCHHTLLLLA